MAEWWIEKKPKPQKAIAYCGSDFCIDPRAMKLKKKTKVKFTDIWCPDCHSALFWASKEQNKYGIGK